MLKPNPEVQHNIITDLRKYNRNLLEASHFNLTARNPYQNRKQKQKAPNLQPTWKSLLKCSITYQLRFSELSLEFNNPTKKDLEVIIRHISHSLRHVRRLKIHFREFQLTLKDRQDFITKVSRNLISFKSLHISFTSCKEFDDQSNQIVSSSRNSQRVTLSLRFSEIANVADSEIKYYISRLIKNQPRLHGLACSIDNSKEFTDEGLKAFGNSGRKYLVRLEDLSLSFKWCNQISNEGFVEFISKITQRMTLQRFALAFEGYNKINNAGLRIAIFKIIKHQKRLQQLRLDFTRCRFISNTGIEMLTRILYREKPRLSELGLDFSGCCYNREQVGAILKERLAFVPYLDIKL